jgi:uncharacterized protein YdcH (DUF465 family)
MLRAKAEPNPDPPMRVATNDDGAEHEMVHKHERLISQFPRHERQIRVLAASNAKFDTLAAEYENLRSQIHDLEASGDVGPDYTDLCNRRDDLQETLIIMMQEAETAS